MTTYKTSSNTKHYPIARRWFSLERLGLIVVVLASALAMSPNVADPDLWGHVQFGRDVLNDGEIAATTSYSYTSEGYRWINHENFSEIVMAIVADSLGPIGLVIGKFLLSMIVIVSILKFNLKTGVDLIPASMITLLVAANLGYHWSIRPQLSSFVGFTLLVLILQISFSGWRDGWHWKRPKGWFTRHDSDLETDAGKIEIRKRLGYSPARIRLLWLAPILFFIWANSHGGFVAGLCVFIAYMGLRSAEALSRGGRIRWHNAGWGIVRRLALMGIIAILATLVNPYGPNLHLWLLESLGSPRPEITDWSNRALFGLVGAKLWLLVFITLFALTMSKRKQDLTQLLLLALTLWQSVSHFRHVPFFAILCGFWIGPHLQSAMTRLANQPVEQPLGRTMRSVVTAALVVCIAVVGHGLYGRLNDLQVRRDAYPVDAIDYMRENNLQGRLVVTYDWAQYAIAALCSDHHARGHQSRVAFDGRFRTCYPQSVVDMYFDFMFGDSDVARHRSPHSPPCEPSRLLNHMQPELVLLRRMGERSELHMYQNADNWVLLYEDGIAQVWGARRLYDDPNCHDYIPESSRVSSDRIATDSVTWPAINDHRPGNINSPGFRPETKLTQRVSP